MVKIKNIYFALAQVFKDKKYLVLLVAITSGFTLFEMWLANYSLILFVYRSNAFSWFDKISILWETIKLAVTVFTLGEQLFMYSIALLVGINFTLLIYYLKKRIALQNAAGVSTLGIIVSLVGVGCTSCGSVILSSVFGFAATTQFLSVLPFRGKEFSLLAAVTLGVSIYLIAQKISNPGACVIPLKNNLTLKKEII